MFGKLKNRQTYKIYTGRVSGTGLCFFVPAFQPVDISKFVKIKNTTLYICVIQKKAVPLQALQMTKVLHMSKKCSTFATEIEMTDVKSTNVPD